MQIIYMKFTRVKILDLQHDYTPPPFSPYTLSEMVLIRLSGWTEIIEYKWNYNSN